MKKLLILTALMAVTGASVGCNCCALRRRADCPPPYGDQCDECQGGAMGPAFGPTVGPPMGAPVMTTPPPMISPGPASTTSQYLPR